MNQRIVKLTSEQRLTKRISPEEITSYPSKATYFGASLEEVNDIFEFSDLLKRLEKDQYSMLVRGGIADDVNMYELIRRRIRKPSRPASDESPNEYPFKDIPCHWLMLDIDKAELPSSLSVIDQPLECIEYLLELLPEEFQNVTTHYQLSASAGVNNKKSISAHLFFWLDEPLPNEQLRTWAKHYNEDLGFRRLDPAVFNPVQPHYTAAPIFDGIDDPLGNVRSALIRKQKHTVSLNLKTVSKPANNIPRNTGWSIKPRGFENKLQFLGDGEGCNGFNDVLVSATAAYAAKQGSDETLSNQEEIKERLRLAINLADKSDHTDERIERYLSDSYLDGIIESAAEKFGRESTPPFYEDNELPLAEADKLLRDTIKNFARDAHQFYKNPIEHDPPVIAIKASAGLGKTTKIIKSLQQDGLLEQGDVHYFVPNHKLSRELCDAIDEELDVPLSDGGIYRRTQIIAGRSNEDPETGEKLCKKYKAAEDLARAGGNVSKQMCKNLQSKCEYYDECLYQKQFNDVDALPLNDLTPYLTQINVMSHEHLFLHTKQRLMKPGLIVIDESFCKSATNKYEVRLSELRNIASPDSASRMLLNLLWDEEPEILAKIRKRFTSLDLIDEANETSKTSHSPDIDPSMSLDEQQNRLRGIASPDNVKELLLTVAEELRVTDRGSCHSIELDGDTVRANRRKEVSLPAVPTILIDADADKNILRQFFPDIELISIKAKRNAEVHQFLDKTFSLNAIEESHKKDQKLLNEIRQFIESISLQGETLVISTKKVRGILTNESEDELKKFGSCLGATFAHFNAIKGTNEFNEYENVIIVGREQLPANALEQQARGIWFDDNQPLIFLESKSGNIPLEDEKRGYRLKSGEFKAVKVQVHPDERVQSMLEQVRECESLQAIDRLRMLRPHPQLKKRNVFILCSIPLDITIDNLWNWSAFNEIIDLVNELGGIVPMNAEHLLEASKKIESKKTAKRRIKSIKEYEKLIKLFLPESVSVEYRESTNNGKYSKALISFYSDMEMAERKLQELVDSDVEVKKS